MDARISIARSKGSLRRLNMDYIDLYWMHVWDTVTPVEEVISTLTDLVRAGKIRYYGFSDVPAWYVGAGADIGGTAGVGAGNWLAIGVFTGGAQHRARTYSRGTRAWPGSLPVESLGQRFPRRQVQPRKVPSSSKGSRLDVLQGSSNPVFNKFTERNWKVLDAVREVAKQMGRPRCTGRAELGSDAAWNNVDHHWRHETRNSSKATWRRSTLRFQPSCEGNLTRRASSSRRIPTCSSTRCHKGLDMPAQADPAPQDPVPNRAAYQEECDSGRQIPLGSVPEHGE